MSIIALIVILIVIGILIWAVQQYLPLDPPFKGVVIFLLILVGCLLMLRAAGVLGSLTL